MTSKTYVLANVRVNDPAGYKSSYQDHVGALVKKYDLGVVYLPDLSL